jgi:Tfp pilus assembly protein PilN
MASFELNLAREYTMNRQKRRRSYWLMMAYFGLCGLLLVDTAYRASRTVSGIQNSQSELAELQHQFAKEHPEQPSIERFIAETEKTLRTQQQQLDLLLRETRDPAPLAECLFRFDNNLPASMRLSHLAIDPQQSTAPVSVSFRMPASRETQDTPLQWVTRWKAEPDLSKILTNLVLADRKDNIQSAGALLTEFSCTADLMKGAAR